MRPAAYRITVVLAFVLGGTAVSLAFAPYRYPTPPTPATPAATADLAPPGWTVACEPSALGEATRLPLMACRTYPPGDDRWMPTAPLPPNLPVALPTGTR